MAIAGTTPGQFSVNESGAATYSIPIQVPSGTAGMQPQLSLEYNSQGGGGLLGMGWSLNGLSAITRCPRVVANDGVRGAVNYDMNDRFCLDGQRLILASGTYGAANSEYRTERESFAKITAHGNAGNGPAYFTMQTKAGLTMELGNTADSKIEAQGKPTVRVWALNRVQDTKSNYMLASYVEESGNGDFYPSRLDYSGNAISGRVPVTSVQFVTEPRSDVESGFQVGSVLKTTRRLIGIKTFHGASLVREYRLSYDQGIATQRSRVKEVSECDRAGSCLLPIRFGAEDSAPASFTNIGSLTPYPQWNSPTLGDFDGDGKADVLINTTTSGAGWYVYMANGNGSFRLTGSLTPYPEWSMPIVADFNGDGKSDILINTNTTGAGWYVYLSNGDGTFRRTTSLTPYYQWTSPLVADFNDDGKADVLINTTTAGAGWSVFMSNGDGTFRNTGSLTPYYQWTTPVVADFDGDGKADVLINTTTQGAGWYVYLSNGDGTFRFGSLLTAYPEWTTPIVADFDGDGRADILINTNTSGAGWFAYLSNGNGTFRNTGSLTPYFQWTTPLIADFNGDGKSDVLINATGNAQGSGWHAYLSSGDGTFRFGSSFTPYSAWTSPRLVDFNGDGKTDILINTTTAGAGWYVYLSNGDGVLRYASSLTQYPEWSTPLIGDFNGDGRSDVLINTTTSGAGWYIYTSPFGLPDRLASVSVGVARATDIVSRPLTDSAVYVKDAGLQAGIYPKIDLQYPNYVVSEVSTSNGLGGFEKIQYSYGGLKAEQGTGRGLLGFRWMKSKSVSNNIESYTEFNQNWPFTATVSRNETRLAGAGNGGLLKRVTNTYSQSTGSAGASIFVYLSHSVEDSWDLNGAVMPRITTTNTFAGYEDTGGATLQWGDPTQIRVDIEQGGVLKRRKATVNEYHPAKTSAGQWQLGRLKKATVTSTQY